MRYVNIMNTTKITPDCHKWANPLVQKEFRRMMRTKNKLPIIYKLAQERIAGMMRKVNI